MREEEIIAIVGTKASNENLTGGDYEVPTIGWDHSLRIETKKFKNYIEAYMYVKNFLRQHRLEEFEESNYKQLYRNMKDAAKDKKWHKKANPYYEIATLENLKRMIKEQRKQKNKSGGFEKEKNNRFSSGNSASWTSNYGRTQQRREKSPGISFRRQSTSRPFERTRKEYGKQYMMPSLDLNGKYYLAKPIYYGSELLALDSAEEFITTVEKSFESMNYDEYIKTIKAIKKCAKNKSWTKATRNPFEEFLDLLKEKENLDEQSNIETVENNWDDDYEKTQQRREKSSGSIFRKLSPSRPFERTGKNRKQYMMPSENFQEADVVYFDSEEEAIYEAEERVFLANSIFSSRNTAQRKIILEVIGRCASDKSWQKVKSNPFKELFEPQDMLVTEKESEQYYDGEERKESDSDLDQYRQMTSPSRVTCKIPFFTGSSFEVRIKDFTSEKEASQYIFKYLSELDIEQIKKAGKYGDYLTALRICVTSPVVAKVLSSNDAFYFEVMSKKEQLNGSLTPSYFTIPKNGTKTERLEAKKFIVGPMPLAILEENGPLSIEELYSHLIEYTNCIKIVDNGIDRELDHIQKYPKSAEIILKGLEELRKTRQQYVNLCGEISQKIEEMIAKQNKHKRL